MAKTRNEVKSSSQSKAQLEENKSKQVSPASKKKMSFNEKREFEILGSEIELLENRKNNLEYVLSSGNLPHEELFLKSEELSEIKSQLDEKELRWLELSELL